MKKLYGKTIDIDVYNWFVPVFYGDVEQLKIWFDKQDFKNGKDFFEILPKTADAFCFIEDKEQSYVPSFIYIGKTKNNYRNITHEALHFTMFLLDQLHVNIDPSHPYGHEALTYLTGYLVGEITKNNWNEYQPNKKKMWKTK